MKEENIKLFSRTPKFEELGFKIFHFQSRGKFVSTLLN